MKQLSLFAETATNRTAISLHTPSAYKGLAAFHKYWGKKPIESLSFLLNVFSEPGDLIIDPFLGSGLIAREAASHGRRFAGCDINPLSVELSTLLVCPPPKNDLVVALKDLKSKCKDNINASYETECGDVASHYLWRGDKLEAVWKRSTKRRSKIELQPTEHDRYLIESFSGYQSRYLRPIRFFSNSRINASPSLSIHDFFTERALRNIDLLLDEINTYDKPLRRALLLSLTSASGQMSKMVFAITRRGKTSGSENGRIEVGSWVIGFWRPNLHFEINVWNCYENRLRKLIRALDNLPNNKQFMYSDNLENIFEGTNKVSLLNIDAKSMLASLPDDSVSLVITDPPHSDRIPYLELSEIWNAILKKEPQFEREIVISNAKERGKTADIYNSAMQDVLAEISRVLRSDGVLAFFFNSRNGDNWYFLNTDNVRSLGLRYLGCFPMSYSAQSVVQDNRKGALKQDFVLLFIQVACEPNRNLTDIFSLPGWSREMPLEGSF